MPSMENSADISEPQVPTNEQEDQKIVLSICLFRCQSEKWLFSHGNLNIQVKN